MKPFIEAFVDEFPKARTPRDRMFLIDTLLHRFHGEYERNPHRPGAINLIGGKPNEVRAFLDDLSGVRRTDDVSIRDADDWIEKVRSERQPGWG